MTCIVGIEHEGKVYIGSDGQTWTGSGTRRQNNKLFKLNKHILIGACGSVRMAQIIRYHVRLEAQQAKQDDAEYVVTEVANKIRIAMKEHAHSKTDGNEELQDGDYLVGYRGRLYHIYTDYSVMRNDDGIDACGSGGAAAIGALYALDTLKPKKRLTRALEIASRLDEYTGTPFYVKWIGA